MCKVQHTDIINITNMFPSYKKKWGRSTQSVRVRRAPLRCSCTATVTTDGRSGGGGLGLRRAARIHSVIRFAALRCATRRCA